MVVGPSEMECGRRRVGRLDGLGSRRPPGVNARNLARIRHPWSRTFLRERDPNFLAWLEGETDVQPGRNGPGWQPLF